MLIPSIPASKPTLQRVCNCQGRSQPSEFHSQASSCFKWSMIFKDCALFQQISWDIRLGSWLLCRANKENPGTAFKCAFHLDGIALFQLLQGICGWLSNYRLSSAAATSRWRRPPIILEWYLKDSENHLKISSRSNPRTWSKVRIDQRLSPPITSIEPLLQSCNLLYNRRWNVGTEGSYRVLIRF